MDINTCVSCGKQMNDRDSLPPPYSAIEPGPYQQCREALANILDDARVRSTATAASPRENHYRGLMEIHMKFSCESCSSHTPQNDVPQGKKDFRRNGNCCQHIHVPPHPHRVPQNSNCCNQDGIPLMTKECDNDEDVDNGPLSIYDLDPDYSAREPEVDYDNQENERRQRSVHHHVKRGLRRLDINQIDQGYEKRKEWMLWRMNMNEKLLAFISNARKNSNACWKSHDKDQPISATSVGAAVDHAYCRPRGLPMSSLEWKHFVLFGIPRAHLIPRTDKRSLNNLNKF